MDGRIMVKGKGKPVVLLHSLAGPGDWGPFINTMAANFKVIQPIFPGYHDDDPVINYSDDFYVDFLESVRQHLGMEKMILAGHSMGGRTGINYAIRHPDRVEKLILIDAVGITEPMLPLRIPLLHRVLPYWLFWALFNPKNIAMYYLDEWVDKESKDAQWSLFQFNELMENRNVRMNFSKISVKIAMKKKEWPKALPSLSVPSLVLWGSEDHTTPRYGAHLLHKWLKGSKLAILHGYRHNALNERPDFFVDEITAFIERQEVLLITARCRE